MNTANTSVIAIKLAQGTTIKNKNAARITDSKVDAKTYANWKVALDNARIAFYAYQYTKDVNVKLSAHGKELRDIEPVRESAMTALQNILDAIGNVNGYALRRSPEMLDSLAVASYKDKDELVGEALTTHSQISNYRDQLKGGGNDEYIAHIEHKLEVAEEYLKVLKKQEGSAKPSDERASFSVFQKNVERKLGLIITEQLAKSPEQVEADEAARKAARKEKAKANKQAKRQAAAQANAQ